MLLELQLSDLFLSAQGIGFLFDVVQLQLLLHLIALLLQLELVELPLRLVQLLRTEWCGETGVTGFLLPQLVELSLRLIEFLGTLEIFQLFALLECIDLFLLGHVRWLCAKRSVAAQQAVGARSHVDRRRLAVMGLRTCIEGRQSTRGATEGNALDSSAC